MLSENHGRNLSSIDAIRDGWVEIPDLLRDSAAKVSRLIRDPRVRDRFFEMIRTARAERIRQFRSAKRPNRDKSAAVLRKLARDFWAAQRRARQKSAKTGAPLPSWINAEFKAELSSRDDGAHIFPAESFADAATLAGAYTLLAVIHDLLTRRDNKLCPFPDLALSGRRTASLPEREGRIWYAVLQHRLADAVTKKLATTAVARSDYSTIGSLPKSLVGAIQDAWDQVEADLSMAGLVAPERRRRAHADSARRKPAPPEILRAMEAMESYSVGERRSLGFAYFAENCNVDRDSLEKSWRNRQNRASYAKRKGITA